MIYIGNQIPYKVSLQQSSNSSEMEKLIIKIPTPNCHMFPISNWSNLPPESSQYLQSTGISLSEIQPDTKVHEVICAYVDVHDIAWGQTANPNSRGEYLVDAAMDASSAFLNDREHPKRKVPTTYAFSSPNVTIVHAAF